MAAGVTVRWRERDGADSDALLRVESDEEVSSSSRCRRSGPDAAEPRLALAAAAAAGGEDDNDVCDDAGGATSGAGFGAG